MLVERTPTPLTEEQLFQVLRAAYLDVFGRPITTSTLAIAWAQVCLEHARGKAVYCSNIGNITTRGEGVDYYELTTDEQVKEGVWKRMTLKYRAHPNAVAGGRAYWELLRDRYSTALAAFEAGEPEAAASALKASKYFTADLAPYSKSMRSLFQEFMRKHASSITDPAMPAVLPGPDEDTPPVAIDVVPGLDFGAIEAQTDRDLRSLTQDEIRDAMRWKDDGGNGNNRGGGDGTS